MLFAVWFVVTMTLAQGCLDTSSPNIYGNASGANHAPANDTRSGGGSSSGTLATPAASHRDTSGYTASQAESQALTQYLTQHRLPLVGAQVLRGPEGQRAVVLYGYAGSDFGKRDATAKASNYMNDPAVTVDNRIKVRPELLATGSSDGASNSAETADASNPDNGAYPGASAYTQQQSEAQQYAQQQQTGATVSSMMPLLMLGMMALSAASGGAFSVAPGGYGPPGSSFGGGSPGYNPYGGYPSSPSNPSFGP